MRTFLGSGIFVLSVLAGLSGVEAQSALPTPSLARVAAPDKNSPKERPFSREAIDSIIKQHFSLVVDSVHLASGPPTRSTVIAGALENPSELRKLIDADLGFIAEQRKLLDQDRYLQVVKNFRGRLDQYNVQQIIARKDLLLAPSEEKPNIQKDLDDSNTEVEKLQTIYAAVLQPTYLANGRLPVDISSSAEAACYWGSEGRVSVPGATLAGKSKQSALAVDLYTDYFGGTRWTLGAGIAAATNADSVAQNAQRFVNAGGSAVLGIAYPLLYYADSPRLSCPGTPATIGPSNGSWTFDLVLWPRLGGDLPAIGADETSIAVHLISVRMHGSAL